MSTSYMNQRRFRYRRMTADQLSQALDDLDLSVAQLAVMTGVREDRIRKWLNRVEDIPPYVPVLCAVLTVPGAGDIAMRTAEHFLEEAP